jgi:4-hydroxy-tetrahydrodipicolinate reductase
MMSKLNSYSIQMEEIHHLKKTRCTKRNRDFISKGIIKNSKYSWTLEEPTTNQIHIEAKQLELFLEHM